MPATPAWLASVEAVLNRSLAGSTRAAELCRQLRGTALDVDAVGWMRVRIAAGASRLSLMVDGEGTADAVISGSPGALLQLLRAGSAARAGRGAGAGAPSGSAAIIDGDAEIANLYRRLIEAARPDLEEELSRWIGDFPARRAAELTRGALGFLARVRSVARENVAEYLQEESRNLVNRTELEEFLRGVDAVRETADRIEARLSRLEARGGRAAS